MSENYSIIKRYIPFSTTCSEGAEYKEQSSSIIRLVSKTLGLRRFWRTLRNGRSKFKMPVWYILVVKKFQKCTGKTLIWFRKCPFLSAPAPAHNFLRFFTIYHFANIATNARSCYAEEEVDEEGDKQERESGSVRDTFVLSACCAFDKNSATKISKWKIIFAVTR